MRNKNKFAYLSFWVKPYQHLVPTNGWSHFFALRFSADGGYISTTNREWWIDDVSIVSFAPDIDEDGDVDFSDFAAIEQYRQYYHHERIHQSFGRIIEPKHHTDDSAEITCIKRLGGLLKSYHRLAA